MIFFLLHILYLILLPCFSVLIVRKCLSTFFYTIPKAPVLYIIFSLYYLFQIIIEFRTLPSPLITLLINFLFIFSLAMICNPNFKQCFLFTGLICSIWMLLEIFVNICFSLLSITYLYIDMIGAIFSNLLMFFLVIMIRQIFFHRKSKNFTFLYWLVLMLIPLSSIYMIQLIFLLHIYTKKFHLFVIGCTILLLFLNFIIFETFDHLMESVQSQKLNLFYEKQLNLCSQQISDYVQQYDYLRELNHDLKKHFVCLHGMICDNKYKEADAYILRLLAFDSNKKECSTSHTGNIIIDSLLNYSKSTCNHCEIRFETDLCIPPMLPIQNEHLCVILGNLIENAIEACKIVSEENRMIFFKISYEKEMLLINIKNSYCNSIKKDKSGNFISTKSSNEPHGYGLISVQNAVRSYQGELLTEYNLQTFQVTVILYTA